MTDLPYDRLMEVLSAFIDEFGGSRRIRGIQTMLLLREATLTGAGISVSEVKGFTGAPLENIRRHFGREVDRGYLIADVDPNDERVKRYRVADLDADMARWGAERLGRGA